MSLEIDLADVIKLVEQFLSEHGLTESLKVLQDESGIGLNQIPKKETFDQNILKGNWDLVLEVVNQLILPLEVLQDLYELIILEMIGNEEYQLARLMFEKIEVIRMMKKNLPARYISLQGVVYSKSRLSNEDIYGTLSKDKRRKKLVESISKELSQVSSSRLLTLISQSVKWQQHLGMLPLGSKFDLFRGQTTPGFFEQEKPVMLLEKNINVGEKSHLECGIFSPDGQFLVTGSNDGFIEVWNFATGKLQTDLKYQKNNEFMMHDSAVLALAFSRDSELLASGSADGVLKVWKIANGTPFRKFLTAHQDAITKISFSKDGTSLLTCSADQTIRIHGLRSGQTLKIFKGHAAFINSVTFIGDFSQILSCSSDSTIKLWNIKNQDCVATLHIEGRSAFPNISGLISHPKHPDEFFVCNRSPNIYRMNLKGKILAQYHSEKSGEGGYFHEIFASPRFEILYGVTEDSTLIAFDLKTTKTLHQMKISEAEVKGLCHHPHLNLLATWSKDRDLSLWKP